jgi:hypothetical protein
MSAAKDLNQINANENQDFDNLDSEQIISNEYGVDERVTNSILTEGSIEKQFREFENTLTDPYATVKNFAQSQREKFNNGYAPETVDPNRLNTNPAIRLSDRASSLFNYAAQSVVESSSTVLRRQEMRGLNQGHHLVGYTSNDSGSIVNNNGESSIVTGLINRPGVQEYNNLFSDSYGTLSATFFQFQNKEVASSLLQRQNETKIVTQGLIPNSTGKANAILANNEITAQLSNLPNRGNLTITRAYSDTESSIHPKMGYNDKYAFIGTQNLTNALPKYNTQENLLVIKRSTDVEMVSSYAGFKSVARILQTNIAGNRNAVHSLNKQDFNNANQFAQGILAEQIVTAQNSLLSVINDDPDSIVNPAKFASKLTENLKTLSNGSPNNMGTYVFTSADIFNRLSSTIANASRLSTTDRVVISGKELNIIFSNGDAGSDVINFKQNILALAKAGRLTIITDNSYINTLSRQNLDPNSKGIDEIGRNILNELTQRNQIRGVSLGVNHEKSTMVFGGGVDDAGQLKFLSTGSANYSAGAMLTANKNTELMVAIGIDNYQQDSNSIVERTMGVSILSQLNREVDNKTIIHDRYETLSGLDFLTGKTTFSDTRIIEQNASTIGVQALKKEIAALNTRLGGNLIELSDRFNSSGKLVGVRTIIRPLDNVSNQVVINLSVNREQNVVLSDLNKVISGSVFVNTGVNSKTINGQVVRAGQTVEMSSMNTAVGFLATITRELSNQSRYQLVDKSYGDLLKSGHINPYETSADYLRLLVPELVQDGGQGKLNLSTIQNAIAGKYQDGNKLAADIHNLSLKIATGHISSFNSLPSGQGGFIDELKANPHNINRRYSLVNSWLTELASGTGETKHLEQLFIALDNDPNRVLADIRLQAVLGSSEGKKKYNKAFNSLSSSLVNLISSPFLALHEQTYGGYQASARTPVYGEGDVANPDTILGRLATEGFMNPLSVAHSTEIGEAGQFYRAINHTASSDYLKLPGHGGLNQVKVIDSDLHEGAVAIYSNKKLFSSLQNHGFINRDEYKSNLESIVNREVNDDELNPIFNTSKVIFNYAFPESKLEQLQQRIKNTTGARVDLDVNASLVKKIKSGRKVDIDDYKTQSDLLIGKIKASLPHAQSEKVKAYLAEFQVEHGRLPTKEETTNYFRSLEFDRSLTERGVIGEESYKRVAINAGFSNMGDYIYGNAAALPDTGYLRLLKIKLDTKNLNNLEDTQRKLTAAFKQGNVIYNEPVEVYGRDLPVINELETKKKEIDRLKTVSNEQDNQQLDPIKNQLVIKRQEHQNVYEKLVSIKEEINQYFESNKEFKSIYESKLNQHELIKVLKEQAPPGYFDAYDKLTASIQEQVKILKPFKESHKEILDNLDKQKSVILSIKEAEGKNSNLINLYSKNKQVRQTLKQELNTYKDSHKLIFDTLSKIDRLKTKTSEIKDRSKSLGFSLITDYENISKEIYGIYKDRKGLHKQFDTLTLKEQKAQSSQYQAYDDHLTERLDNLAAIQKGLRGDANANKSGLTNYLKIKDQISKENKIINTQKEYTDNEPVFRLLQEIRNKDSFITSIKNVFKTFSTDNYTQDQLYVSESVVGHELINEAIWTSNSEDNKAYGKLLNDIDEINKIVKSNKLDVHNKKLFRVLDNLSTLSREKGNLISNEKEAGIYDFLQRYKTLREDLNSINRKLYGDYKTNVDELNILKTQKAGIKDELNTLVLQVRELNQQLQTIRNNQGRSVDVTKLQNEYNKLLKENSLIVVTEGNQTKYKLDKGLYSFDEAGKPIQLGRFEREGIITLNNINVTDSEGRHSAVSFKVGSAKDKGYSIFTDNVSIVAARDKGVLTIEASELVIKNPSSGIRLVGVKGPVLYMDAALFNNVKSHLNQRTRDIDAAGRFNVNVNQEVYSMNTFSQFKEFSYESGIKLLSVDSVRQSLTGEKNAISGHNLAENLALLFIEKGEGGEVRTALQEHLSNTGRRQVAQTLNNIKGGDFSEISDGKAKFNLGVIANGLTMLADPSDPNYSKNVIEGNLTGVRQLVLRALKEGPQGDEARLLLQQQSKALINLAYEKGGVYGHNSELLYFEGNSPIVKGAGMLTHVNFIGSQLLNNPFEKGKSNLQSGLFELKVDNVNTYLTNKVHRQKVDFVASTAGMSLDEFNKDNLTDVEKGKLETKLSFLQKQFDSGVIIQDIKSITTSSSLVAAGVNNETAFEYQNLAGTSISYLNRYRRQNKIRDEGTLIRTKESQTIRTAYAIILSASLNEDHLYDHNRSIPSLNPEDLISYRSILHKPSSIQDTRGWHTDRVDTINSLITNFTPIANRIGLLDQAIDSGDKSVYETVGKINTMAVGINNDPAVINRAIALAEVTSKFIYYSDMTGDESAINHSQKQAQSLHDSLINKRYSSNLNSLELVSKVINDQYTNYLNQTETIAKNRSNSPDIMLDSFSEYVAKQNPLFNNDIYNEQVINTIKNLESSNGKLRGINGSAENREEQVKLAIYKENERSAKVVEESLYVDRVGRAKQYVDAMLSMHDIVATKLETDPSNAKLNDYVNEVSKTKNLILPAFQAIAQEDGSYQLQFKTIEAVSPHQGTLLGTDVIGKVPLVFPGHVEDVLINQIRLRKQIEVVQPTLLEIHQAVEEKRAITLSGEQVQQLHELTDLMHQSVEGVKSLANTSFAQKSYSEGETFYGNNTIPVNSLAISANEAVVGDKINNLVQGNPVEQVIESYFESIKKTTKSVQNNAERATLQHADIEKLKILYGNLGAKGDTLRQAAQYEQALESAYPVDTKKPLTISEVENLHQRYSEAITGIKYEDREFISKDIMTEHYTVREVAARRGGAPAGIAASIATEFFNRTLSVNTYNQNMERKGSLLKVDPSRAYTAVILPTLSHLIAQQGDYDGDSFQLLMSNAGDNAQELLTIKNKQRVLLDQINERRSVINDRQTLNNNDTYQSSTEDILKNINVLQTELDIENEREQTHLNLLSKGLSASKVLESSELNHMKKWTAFNQAIPLGVVMDMSAGTVTSFSNFGRTTIGNVEDSVDYSSKAFDKYEQQLKAFTTLQKIYGSNFDINADHTNKSTLGQYELDLRNAGIDMDVKNIDEAFTAIKSINPEGLDYRNVSESLLTYHAAQSSMSQAFDAYIKHNAKAAGTLLDPQQIDLMQSLIGQAGTDLLGKSYNTLIPLLDQAMSDKGLQEVLNVSLNKQGSNKEFEKALNENAQRLGMSAEDANTLLTKLTSAEQIDKVNTRAEATFAFLGSMQQVIRDALKDKSGRGLKSNLTEILKTEYEDGRTVGDILKSPDEDLKYEDINKARNLIFKHYVGTRLGSNLNINIPNNTPDNIKQLFTNARAGYVDSGVTGFGGLLMLRELALTETQEDYKKRFIDNDPSLLESFNKDLEKGTVKSAQEFATRHVLNLLQRTQASFADAMLGEPQRNAKVNALINYGEKFTQQQIDSIENVHAKAGLQLMKDYGEFRKTTAYTSLNEADQKLLNTQFSQDVSLHTIRERGGLTVDDLYYLQTSAKETKRIRNHQEGTNTQEGEAESAFDPKVIQNAAIDQEFHPASIATIQRMLKRGHISADQAQSLFMDKLNSVESAIGDQPHLTPQQQEQTALMLGFNTRADLNQQERMVLAQTVSQTSSTLQHDSQSIQSLYSASEQFDNISQAIKLASTENELRELQQRQRHYSRLMNHHATNINQEKVQQTTDVTSNVEQSPHILENILNKISVQSENLAGLHSVKGSAKSSASTGITLRHDQSLSALGALAVPLFLGALTDDINLNDRALTFGYDLIQGTAHLATKQDRLITQVGELNSVAIQQRSQQTAANFQRSRITQNLQSEGALIGGLQSIAQETMFMTLSEVAYKGVDKLLARSGYENMKVGRGLGVIAAELITTVAAMSVSRAVTKQRTTDGDYVPDFVGRMLQDFAQQIWLAAEQAQLDQNKLEYEVIDTDENMNLDSTSTALLSQTELDIATGFITFDDDSAEVDGLNSSIPTFKSSYYG